jgi:hypothetical protein
MDTNTFAVHFQVWKNDDIHQVIESALNLVNKLI